METNLLRTKEACEFFKVSDMTLFRWRKLKDFPQPLRHGRVILHDTEKIKEWLATKSN